MDLLLKPRGPMLFRDGRPFAAFAGATANSLPWPYPSTVAGALRTWLGNAAGWDWKGNGPERARQVMVKGPLVVSQLAKETPCVYVPSPADAWLGEDAEAPQPLRRLTLAPGQGAIRPHPQLSLLAPPANRKAKPGAPLWSLSLALKWLIPNHRDPWPPLAFPAVEMEPPLARRVHVSVDAATRTAREGRLFTIEERWYPEGPSHAKSAQSHDSRSMALLARLEAEAPDASLSRHVFLGGERGVAWVDRVDGLWPQCPQELSEALRAARFLRMWLVTPVAFRKGWLPGWVDEGLVGSPPSQPELRLRLLATALPRRTSIGGFDVERGRPKPLRLATAAGAVYIFERLDGEPAAHRLWLESVADDEQDRRDGFGLALWGPWQEG
jgi:CRISPR-associated protein Cmr3